MRTFAIAALAATALMLVNASTAVAASPGKNGLIAFTRNGDIWVMKANGSSQHRIARNAFEPRWSPDGKRIAFTRAEAIWVMNAGGGQQLRVTRAPLRDGEPAWSPNGRWILFQSNRADPGGGDFGIYKLRSAHPFGKVVTVVPEVDFEDALSPAYAANGRFTYKLDQDDVDFGNCCDLQVRAHGTDSTLAFCLCIGAIDWSPDSRVLAYGNLVFSSDQEDFVSSHIKTRTLGGVVHDLRRPGRAKNFYDENPSWAPAGGWLVFDEYYKQPTDQRGIWKMRADGTGRTQITATGSQPNWQPVPG